MKKSVLILGGAGNLGSWITELFFSEGWDVSITSHSGKRTEVSSDVLTIHCDLSSPKSVENALRGKKFHTVVHAANHNDINQEVSFWKSYRVNVEGTSSLLHAIDKKSLKKFIFLSTFHVYGSQDGPLCENSPCKPGTDYATSHLAAEFIVQQHSLAEEFSSAILRLTNGFGAPRQPKSANWKLIFNDLVKSAFFDKEVLLKSNPQSQRDFIWMGDISRAVFKLASQDFGGCHVFNLGSGTSLSLADFASQIRQAYGDFFGVELPVVFQTPGNPCKRLVVSCKKIWDFIADQPTKSPRQEAVEAFQILSTPGVGLKNLGKRRG